MIATDRKAVVLSGLLELAANRGFPGLVLDGVDLNTALAVETEPHPLAQAADIAHQSGERVWAERFARRACEIDSSPPAVLRLASILASNGRCTEAQSILGGMPSDTDGELFRQVNAVLSAKAGDADQTLALFDTMPGGAKGYHPATIVFTTVWEMMDQCHITKTAAVVAKLVEKYPLNLHLQSLNLRCYVFSGNFGKARELAQVPESVLERAVAFDRRAFVEAVADSLELPGRTGELIDFFCYRIRKDPTHWSLYDRATNHARLAARDDDYAELIAAIPSDVRKSPEALAILCRWHVDNNRFEQAREILSELRPVSAGLFLQAQLYFSLYAYAREPGRIDEALRACVDCGVPHLGPAVAYGFHTYYYNCSTKALRNCLAKLEPFVELAWTHLNFWQIYLRCLIAVGEQHRAVERYHALPQGLANSALLRPFDMYFDAIQGRHAKARQGWTNYIRDTRHLCVNAPSSYPKTIDLKYTESPGAVLLFVTLYNAMSYLDWFLTHYRALGVDHFFIIDNGSIDGSLQRLREEADVSIFANHESFAKAGFGVLWVNHLMQRFGVGHWCFHVDIDEGFVFPDFDGTRTLRDLLSYCDDRGYCLVPAIELDMYPESLDGVSGSDPFAASCYFDVDYIATQSELPPYVMLQGGIRQRLTGLALSMQKSPLVRMAPDLRYVECNHSTTHLPVADVSGALLHYKFVGDMRGRVEEAISRGEHFGSAISYRRLDSAVNAASWDRSMLSPHSRRYTGPESLARHGLIRSSPSWEAYQHQWPRGHSRAQFDIRWIDCAIPGT